MYRNPKEIEKFIQLLWQFDFTSLVTSQTRCVFLLVQVFAYFNQNFFTLFNQFELGKVMDSLSISAVGTWLVMIFDEKFSTSFAFRLKYWQGNFNFKEVHNSIANWKCYFVIMYSIQYIIPFLCCYNLRQLA